MEKVNTYEDWVENFIGSGTCKIELSANARALFVLFGE